VAIAPLTNGRSDSMASFEFNSAVQSRVSGLSNQTEDLLADLTQSFVIDSDYVTHIGMMLTSGEKTGPTGTIALIEKKTAKEHNIIVARDFVPLQDLSKYKTEKCDMVYRGYTDDMGLVEKGVFLNEKNLQPESAPFVDIPYKLHLPGKEVGVAKILIKNGLDFVPTFAASVSGSACDLLGYIPFNELPEMSPKEFRISNDVTAGAITILHESRIDQSKTKYVVCASIFDRIKNEKISMPINFLSNKDGLLERPLCISFSRKMEEEIGLDRDSEFALFSDNNHIYLTHGTGDYWATMSRLPISDLVDSSGRVRSRKIESAIKRNLALSRAGTEIDFRRFRRIMDDWKKYGSRLGEMVKLYSMSVAITSTNPKGRGFITEIADDLSVLYSSLIPQLLHLCLAKSDPELRGEMKLMREGKKGRRGNVPLARPSHRVLKWGTDRIRYVTGDGSGKTKSRHWVSPHPRRIGLKKRETIEKYRNLGRLVEDTIEGTFGWKIIRGHYRGTGDEVRWNGTYNFGKTPRNYSRAAIDWLTWLEKERGIEIRHAEARGEYRIETKNSYILLDGYCEETHTAFEFHGDLFHGNPRLFEEDEYCNPYDKTKTAGELYRLTKRRETAIVSLGFNLEVIWESDWNSMKLD
jgi:hypothetical protein